jgi:hypothetical protein
VVSIQTIICPILLHDFKKCGHKGVDKGSGIADLGPKVLSILIRGCNNEVQSGFFLSSVFAGSVCADRRFDGSVNSVLNQQMKNKIKNSIV